MKEKFPIQSGFTLLEILAIMGVIVAMGSIILSTVFIFLRGSSKSDLLVTIKQNGDFALSQMVKSLRYAKSVDDPVSCVPTANLQHITFTSLADGGQTTFSCPATQTDVIASNGAALMDATRISVTNCSFFCTQQTLNESPTIKIQFTLSAKNQTGLVETTASLPFESTVRLRNFNR